LLENSFRKTSIAFLPVDSTRIALAIVDILRKTETRFHPDNILLTLNSISIFQQSRADQERGCKKRAIWDLQLIHHASVAPLWSP